MNILAEIAINPQDEKEILSLLNKKYDIIKNTSLKSIRNVYYIIKKV